MSLDYETLRLIWWVLLGLLLIGFAVTGGFDLGVAMWSPFLTRTNTEKRVLINCIGPTWEGNQVWFITSGGAIFAAWPTLYALSFSGFYGAMLLVLLALIVRAVGFKYRSTIDNVRWRGAWDMVIFVGGFVPALVFGVAIGNVFQGVPFYFDDQLRVFYTGTFLELFNPFSLFCGLLSLSMFAMHGAFFIQVKTVGHLKKRARIAGRIAGVLTVSLFLVGGAWVYWGVDGYVLSSPMPHDGPSNPLYKVVIREAHGWYVAVSEAPIRLLPPLFGVFSGIMAVIFARFARTSFLWSAGCVAGIVATVGSGMFPFLLPSSTTPNQSLTIWDSSSSQHTLSVMLVVTVILLPIVIAYTSWVYYVLRGKVTERSVEDSGHSAY